MSYVDRMERGREGGREGGVEGQMLSKTSADE